MDDKKAATILRSLLDRFSFNDEEKEAIRTASGVLSWSSLGQSRIARIKARKAKLDPRQ